MGYLNLGKHMKPVLISGFVAKTKGKKWQVFLIFNSGLPYRDFTLIPSTRSKAHKDVNSKGQRAQKIK